MGMFEAAQLGRKSVKPDAKDTAGDAAKSADPAVPGEYANDEAVKQRWTAHHTAQAKHHESMAKSHQAMAEHHRGEIGKYAG